MKKMNKNNKMRRFSLLATSLFVASSASAIQSLTDGDLSGVTAQDGVTIELEVPSVAISSVVQCFDSTNQCSSISASGSGFDDSKLTMANLAINKIGMDGAAAAGNFLATTTIDAFVGPTGLPGMALSTTWNRARVKLEQQLTNTAGTAQVNMGTFALDSSGKFDLIGSGGLLNTGSNLSRLLLQLDDADLFVRNGTAANAPEAVMHGADFKWSMPQGIVGVDSQGILLQGDVDFNLTFDLLYDGAGASPFQVTAADIPILHYGWTGGLQNAVVRVGGGGSWVNTSVTGSAEQQLYNRSAKTQGINLSLAWDYKPDFYWVVGKVDPTPLTPGDVESLRFGNWVKLPTTTQPANQPVSERAFDFPLISIDMLRAGRGPGGLCWGANWEGPKLACEHSSHGGRFIEVAPEDNAMGVVIRDGFLRAYSTDVRILDPNSPIVSHRDRTMGWALIYTMGNIDANIYLRPDERAGKTGMKADVVAMSQTFDVDDGDNDGKRFEQGANWGYGTHFMIGDTQSNLGIGLINSSFLLAADNLFINMLPSGISIGDSDLLSASPQLASPVRFAFNGRLGGGHIPSLGNPGTNQQVNISDIRLNLEFDRFHFMMKPPPSGQTYLGFEATMRFTDLDIANFSDTDTVDLADPGSFIMLSEPGRPDASVRFASINGWMAARNGRLQLVPETTTAPAQLVMENDLLVGRSVKNEANAELVIGRVEFSQTAPVNQPRDNFTFNNVGSIVIPGGQWYSRIALQPK